MLILAVILVAIIMIVVPAFMGDTTKDKTVVRKEDVNERKKRSSEYRDKIDTLVKTSGINNRIYWSPHDYRSGATALSINEVDSTVIILEVPSRDDFLSELVAPKIQRINFRDIIEANITSNSTTVTSTSRGSQLGGALVGGVLAGGAGAIIGGLSGKTKSNETIRNLKLEVVVSSISNPIIEVLFSEPNVELKAGTPEYEESIRIINDWYRKFTVILHQQNQQQV